MSATTAQEHELLIADRGAVRWLTLNRPHRANSLTPGLAGELTQAVRSAPEAGVRALVITGSGDRFCGGADLGGSVPLPDPANLIEARERPRVYFDLIRTIWDTDLPVVAGVNGAMYGIGVLVALAADLVVAVRGAPVGQVFSERGNVAHNGDPYILPRVFPFRRLMEFAMLGQRFTTDDLERWDVINWVVDPNDLDKRIEDVSSRVASGPTVSLGLTKRMYRRSLESDIDTSFREDATSLALVKSTSDYHEGLQAFRERRDANFQGR